MFLGLPGSTKRKDFYERRTYESFSTKNFCVELFVFIIFTPSSYSSSYNHPINITWRISTLGTTVNYLFSLQSSQELMFVLIYIFWHLSLGSYSQMFIVKAKENKCDFFYQLHFSVQKLWILVYWQWIIRACIFNKEHAHANVVIFGRK
jgi:hypothetical protein